jgi:hypothetical protein
MLSKTGFYAATLADEMRILYFLEDRAQEGFIKALVEKIAKEESIDIRSLNHDIRSARGGSRVIIAFRNFIRDTIKTKPSEIDLLIVAVDGNCKGHKDRVEQLEKCIKLNHPFKNRVIYAVPDPHIERWYITDQKAFRDGIGLKRPPDMPPYKCKKDHYKKVLTQALRESNVSSLLGGVEYAEKIVDNIVDLDLLGRQNAGFHFFVQELKRVFRGKAKE